MSREVTPRVTWLYAHVAGQGPDPQLHFSVYAPRTKEGTPSILPLIGPSYWALEFGPFFGKLVYGPSLEIIDRVFWAQLLLWTLDLGPFGEVGPI